MATTVLCKDFVSLVAAEMSSGVERAVECWLTPIEEILSDANVTALGKVNAIDAVIQNYKSITGKGKLRFASRQ